MTGKKDGGRVTGSEANTLYQSMMDGDPTNQLLNRLHHDQMVGAANREIACSKKKKLPEWGT